jgi:hypothetical protein
MKKKIVEKQLKEVVIDSYTICDKCDSKIEGNSGYDHFQSSLIHDKGVVYPDFTNVVRFSIDFCEKCSEEAIMILNKNGFKINNETLED